MIFGLFGSVLRSQCYGYRIFGHKILSAFVYKLVFSAFVLFPSDFLVVLAIVTASPQGEDRVISTG